MLRHREHVRTEVWRHHAAASSPSLNTRERGRWLTSAVSCMRNNKNGARGDGWLLLDAFAVLHPPLQPQTGLLDRMASNQQALSYLVDHVFLPPMLPSSDKAKSPQNGSLISIALRSLTEFRQYAPPGALTSAVAAMENMALAHDLVGTVTISDSGFTKALKNLHSDGTGSSFECIHPPPA